MVLREVINTERERYWNLTNNIGKTLRRGVPSSTPETLPLICEENRLELARVCGVSSEDVVMTWVSEMQEMVSPDNIHHDYSLC